MTIEILAEAGSWLWEKYGKDLVEATRSIIREEWKKFHWKDAATSYRTHMYEHYSTIHILGNPKPITLEDVFTDVYVLDKPTSLRYFDIENLRTLPNYRDSLHMPGKRKNALRIALEKESLFILGKPGAGKTTFLKYITLKSVEGKIPKIPIFVSLKEWSDTQSELMNFIVKQFEICDFPDAQAFIEHILSKGEAICLFDGLDEVSQENNKRARLTSELINFVKRYSNSQHFITCRIAATDYVFERFTYVEIADFDDRQIRTFANNWFKDSPAKSVSFLQEFEKQENESLRELARTPLLLTLICLTFDETLTIPHRRVEIYEEALDALLKKWDSSRNIKRDDIYRKLSLGRKRQMFARIASDAFENGDYFFRQKDLVKQITDYLRRLPPVDEEEDIDGEAVVKSIIAQHGIFVEQGRKVYSFSHLTFQEYFTARYIADNVASGTLEKLIKKHLHDSRWREVFLLVASLMDNANPFFELLIAAINQLMALDKDLIGLVKWANETSKVSDIGTGYAIRALAMSIGLSIAHSRALIHASGTCEVVLRNIDTYLDHKEIVQKSAIRSRRYLRDIANDFLMAINYAIARNCAYLISSNQVLALTNQSVMAEGSDEQILERAIEATNLFSKLRGTSTSDINDVDEMCKEARDIAKQNYYYLSQEQARIEALLESCAVARKKANSISRKLSAVLTPKEFVLRNIPDLQLPHSQSIMLYCEANRLLLDCLRLAYVSNRGRIENRLFTIPQG